MAGDREGLVFNEDKTRIVHLERGASTFSASTCAGTGVVVGPASC